MSKKHFIALADHIRLHNRFCQEKDTFTVEQLAELATFCYQQNPRFNRERWMDYIAGKCGPNGGKVKL